MNLQSLSKFGTLFQIIGMLFVAQKLIKGFIGFYRAFLRKRRNLLKRYGQNSWAFVTGASDGIGQEFCRQLAKIGFNIVLVARTEKKLIETANELVKLNPKIQTRVVVADLSKSNDEGWAQNIYEQVKDLDISMMVNNAGIDVFDYLEKIDPNYLKKMVAINCVAILLLNQQFASKLNKRSNKSAIINVSSGVVKIPLAYYSTYNGTKALVDTYTLSVNDEFKNIDFMSMQPYDVSTNMIGNRETDVMTITRAECVSGFLNCLGHEVQSVGHWKHRLQDYVYSLLNRRLINFIYFKYLVKDFFAERKDLIPTYRGLPYGTPITEENKEKETKKTN